MSSAVTATRIATEIRDLRRRPSTQFFAGPIDDANLLDWHFTLRGPADTDFADGLYHGRIVLPPDYPLSPPAISFANESGRFEVSVKVCLSMSAHHPESWSPTWSIRLMLEAIQSFLPSPPAGALGSLDADPETRRRLALESRNWCCPRCGPIAALLPTEGAVAAAAVSAAAAVAAAPVASPPTAAAPPVPTESTAAALEPSEGETVAALADSVASAAATAASVAAPAAAAEFDAEGNDRAPVPSLVLAHGSPRPTLHAVPGGGAEVELRAL